MPPFPPGSHAGALLPRRWSKNEQHSPPRPSPTLDGSDRPAFIGDGAPSYIPLSPKDAIRADPSPPYAQALTSRSAGTLFAATVRDRDEPRRARMDRDEAQALAHLASKEMGLAARCEQIDTAAWAVVVGEGSQERRIREPAEYRAWRDETLGDPSQDAAAAMSKRTPLWRSLGWALSGLVGLLSQAISAVFISQRSELDVRERERETLSSHELDDLGYRRTHPPDQR